MKHLKIILLLALTLGFTAFADDNSGKTFSKKSLVKSQSLSTITLISDETNIVRTKDVLAGEYMPTVLDIKVMAAYADGKSEEVTDKVTWQGVNDKVAIDDGKIIFYDENNITLKASYHNVQSNPVTLTVQNAENTGEYLYAKIFNSNSLYFPGRGAGVEISLLKEPASNVVLPIRLERNDKIGFRYSDALVETLRFKTGKGWDIPQLVTIKDKDINNTQPYTLYTDAFESDDNTYDGIDPKDIVITPVTSIELIAPPLTQRKGAIRGVRIEMLLIAKLGKLKDFRLINPPKGMYLANPPLHSIDEYEEMSKSAKSIVWDVPMDIEETTYNITVEASDTQGKKGSITFPIKVPKTTPIQTEIINNELIVTQKDSSLFGMKMKGHKGEDISGMKLRSVAYEDVWKFTVKNSIEEDIVQRAVYIMDNMLDAIDLKFPEYDNTLEKAKQLGASLFRYEADSSGDYWIHADDNSYQYEGTDGVTIPYNRYSGEYYGSRVFLDIVRKSQLIGSQK